MIVDYHCGEIDMSIFRIAVRVAAYDPSKKLESPEDEAVLLDALLSGETTLIPSRIPDSWGISDPQLRVLLPLASGVVDVPSDMLSKAINSNETSDLRNYLFKALDISWKDLTILAKFSRNTSTGHYNGFLKYEDRPWWHNFVSFLRDLVLAKGSVLQITFFAADISGENIYELANEILSRDNGADNDATVTFAGLFYDSIDIKKFQDKIINSGDPQVIYSFAMNLPSDVVDMDALRAALEKTEDQIYIRQLNQDFPPETSHLTDRE